MKLIDLIEKYYDDYREKYAIKIDRKPILEEEKKKKEKELREEGYYSGYNSHRWLGGTDKYFGDDWDWRKLDEEQKELNKDIPNLKNRLIKLNKIINNNEQLISLKRDQLKGFTYDKIILEVGISGLGQSNSNIKGNIKGNMSGSSFLGFGDIGGYIDGFVDGNSNSKYEDYILIKYKYNLDYEIEECLFDINEYLGGDINE